MVGAPEQIEADITGRFVPGAVIPLLQPLYVQPNGTTGTTPTGTRARDISGIALSQYVAFTCDLVTQAFSPSCQSRGKFLTSLFGYSVGVDTRDDPIDPSRGVRFSFSQAIAGLGGDVNYLRTEATGAYYQPLFAGFVGKLQLRGGYITGYGGDEVRLQDRFYEGADSFRGFEVAGVGPRYLLPNSGLTSNNGRAGQAIGAKAYAIGTVEIKLPLPLPKEYGIRTSLFSDFGTVGLVDNSNKVLNDNLSLWVDPDGDGIFEKPIQDDLSLRVTAGVSVSWDSPFGPVRFDFAKVLRKEDYDRTEGFRFSAGTTF